MSLRHIPLVGRGARPKDSELVRFAIGSSIGMTQREKLYVVFEDPVQNVVSGLHFSFRVPLDYSSGGSLKWLWTIFAGTGLAGWASRYDVTGDGSPSNQAFGAPVAPAGVTLPASLTWEETSHAIPGTLAPAGLVNVDLYRNSLVDTHANGLIVDPDTFAFEYDDGA